MSRRILRRPPVGHYCVEWVDGLGNDHASEVDAIGKRAAVAQLSDCQTVLTIGRFPVRKGSMAWNVWRRGW